MGAPWGHWETKEVTTSRAKPLEEESATIAIVQSILLRIVHMKEEKRNPRSLFSRRRDSTSLPRGVVTKLLFMKSTYPRMKKMVMMIAMHSKSSSTSSSLFDSPNENKIIVHRCLMAREVISKSINPNPSSNTTNPLQEELDNECEDDGVDYSEGASLAFMKTLKGESLARFLNLMRSLTERDDYIGNVETLLMEEKERNDLLEQNLL